MTFVPIVERELRVRARQWPTYWGRVIVGGIGTLLCAQLLGVGEVFGSPAEAGRYAFQGLVVLGFIVCSLACLATADSISWERREKTLGLLFLTRVRVRDILLGKFASGSLFLLGALVAFLPVMMLPVLAGGVSGSEAFRVGLMLLATALLSLMAGLLASTWNEEWPKAFAAAIGLVAGLLLLPLILQIGSQPTPTVGLLSPVYGVLFADDPGAPFWTSLALILAIVTILFIRAHHGLRRALAEDRQDKSAEAESKSIALPSRLLTTRHSLYHAGSQPIGWLLRRQKGVRGMLWAGALVGLLFFGFQMFFPMFSGPTGMGWSIGVASSSFVGTFISGGLFAWAASRFFCEARRSGEFELLLTTPAGAKTLVSEQWLFLRHAFRWPLVVLLLPTVFSLFSILFLRRQNFGGTDWLVFFCMSYGASIVTLLLGLAAYGWVGMWFGIRARTQTLAVLNTLLWVKAIPYLLGFVLRFPLRLFAGTTSGWSIVPTYLWFSLLPTCLTVVFYLWLIQRTRRQLLGEIRDGERKSLLPFGTHRSIADAFRRARHWTPL